MKAQRPVLDAGAVPAAARRRRRARPTSSSSASPSRSSPGSSARSARPLGGVATLTPQELLESVHQKLLHAGLANRSGPRSSSSARSLCRGAVGCGAARLGRAGLGRRPGTRLLALLLLPSIGVLLPSSWLTRKVDDRKLAILKDLPDTLDLLAISVEAGMGFEGALDVVCEHFDSPLADEFHRTLREMELGLPRREALQNLKRRTEVPELSNFVLALTQADALGHADRAGC